MRIVCIFFRWIKGYPIKNLPILVFRHTCVIPKDMKNESRKNKNGNSMTWSEANCSRLNNLFAVVDIMYG